MKTVMLRIILGLSFLFIFNTFTYAQSDDTAKIKNSFVQAIGIELKSLQEWGLRPKNDPARTLQFRKVDDLLKRTHQSFKRLGVKNDNQDHLFEDKWKSYYSEWSNEYSYDIKKTNSIISPYIGLVTFYGKQYYKEGKTKEECLNSPWRLETSDVDGRPRIYKPTLKYVYQEGKWILKDAPVAYKSY